MGTRLTKTLLSLGFLTVVEHETHGLLGGYLLVNGTGRPLEFHCTVPIKPNRAQEILYGPTLEPYLYGEQIGKTLVAAAKTKPIVICTDLLPAMAVEEHVNLPVLLVDSQAPDDELLPPAATTQESGRISRVDAPHNCGPQLAWFRFRGCRVAVSTQSGSNREVIQSRLERTSEVFDLAEPFERIRRAIEEAQRGSS